MEGKEFPAPKHPLPQNDSWQDRDMKPEDDNQNEVSLWFGNRGLRMSARPVLFWRSLFPPDFRHGLSSAWIPARHSIVRHWTEGYLVVDILTLSSRRCGYLRNVIPPWPAFLLGFAQIHPEHWEPEPPRPPRGSIWVSWEDRVWVGEGPTLFFSLSLQDSMGKYFYHLGVAEALKTIMLKLKHINKNANSCDSITVGPFAHGVGGM